MELNDYSSIIEEIRYQLEEVDKIQDRQSSKEIQHIFESFISQIPQLSSTVSQKFLCVISLLCELVKHTNIFLVDICLNNNSEIEIKGTTSFLSLIYKEHELFLKVMNFCSIDIDTDMDNSTEMFIKFIVRGE